MQESFFIEIAQSFSQVVALINHFIGTCSDFVAMAFNSVPAQKFFAVVNQFPADIRSLVVVLVSMAVFDFFRGR